MKRENLPELLANARRQHVAVGAFNIFNELSARAAVTAAESLGRPVILQTSAAAVRQYGPARLASLLRAIRDEARVPVVVHLGHCTDPELAIRCAETGWDSVMIDASHQALDENIRLTRLVCSEAHALGVHVEGEIGVISGIEDDIAAGTAIGATLEETLRYAAETGIDAVAPAIGIAHGVYHGIPVIAFARVAALSACCACPIVIRGGTGLPGETLQRLTALGAAKINVSTAIKQSYLAGQRSCLAEYPDAGNPLQPDQAVAAAVAATVRRHLLLFQSGHVEAVPA